MSKAANRVEHSMLDPRNRTSADHEYDTGMEAYFDTSIGTNLDKLRSFAKFVPRQILSTFLGRVELFRLALNVPGHIMECRVFLGAGLMTWANLSAIYEPFHHIPRIVGFDTFSGIISLNLQESGSQTTQ